MTDQTAPVENVTRGALLALLAIPAAGIAFAIVGGIFGIISGIAAIIVPFIAAFLYRVGAGAPLSRAGWTPFVVISAVAVLFGVFAGIATSAFSAFTAVGGKNALINPAFWRAVGNQFTLNLGDNFAAIAIGVVVGIFGIVQVLRGRTFGSRAGGRGAPQNVATTENPYPAAVPGAAPITPAAPPVTSAFPPITPAAPPVPPAPNAPSPGVILNGKPIEPQK